MSQTHEIITIARESRGVSQTKLADLMNISQSKVSKFEADLLAPDEDELLLLSKALRYPVSFFKTEKIPLVANTAFYFRKMKTVKQGELKVLDGNLKAMVMHLRGLLKSVDIEAPLKFPYFDREDFDSECAAEEIAERTRLSLCQPTGPISNMIKTLESVGCIVLPSRDLPKKVDAVSLWVHQEDLPPFVFYNPDKPSDRIRRTLAHEFGHLIMHARDTVRGTEEEEADRFADEFLTPEKEITRALPMRPTLPSLLDVKQHWKVSIQSLIMRGNDLGVYSEAQKRSLFVQISQKRWNRNEPFEPPKETSSTLSKVIEHNLTTVGLTVRELASMAMMDVEDFRLKFDIKKTESKTIPFPKFQHN